MENYKIKVANEAERSESTNLLKELGFFRRLPEGVVLRDFVCTDNDGEILYSNIDDNEKELTLPQLKDLVVLKRNDKLDRNVIDPWYVDTNLYLDSKDNLFVFYLPTKEWKKSNLNHDGETLSRLKPIEPKMSILDTGRLEMKEYLVKDDATGDYFLTENHSKFVDAIEIPVGADTATIEKENAVYFWNEANNTTFADGVWNICDEFNFVFLSDYLLDNNNRILWQRHTQPEEIPFIDDKKYDAEEIDLAIGYDLDELAKEYDFRYRWVGESDETYRHNLKLFIVSKPFDETTHPTQGANGERLKASIEEFKNTDHGVEFDNFNLLPEFDFTPTTIPRTASEIADASLVHIKERASTYDQQGGERSAAKTAQAFNAITGHNVSESEVWLMLQLLKDVRQWSRENYHQDSAEDCIAYASLKAEALEQGR